MGLNPQVWFPKCKWVLSFLFLPFLETLNSPPLPLFSYHMLPQHLLQKAGGIYMGTVVSIHGVIDVLKFFKR